MWKHIVISVAASLIISQATTAQSLSVSDLLDKYQATQERLKAFIAKSEETTMVNDSRGPKRLNREVAEFRTDGNRVNYLSYLWNDIDAEDEPIVTEETTHKSFLWDGKSFYEYRKGLTVSANRAFIKRHDGVKKHFVSTAYGGAPLTGIFSGDLDPVGSILRQANTILVRSEMEQIGNSQCYVIDAATRHGKYSIWLDPQHGYNIVKAQSIKAGDDLAFGKPLDSNRGKKPPLLADMKKPSVSYVLKEVAFSMENVRFEQVDNIWVPMEADFQETHTYEDGRIVTIERHHKRTTVDLKPDFDAMGAFVPHIPNGTKVYLEGVDGIEYRWVDGKLFADVDEFVIDQIDKIAVQVIEDKPADSTKNLYVTPAVKNSEAPKDNFVKTITTQRDAPKPQQNNPTRRTVSFTVVLICVGLLIVGVVVWIRCHQSRKVIDNGKT